MDWRVVEALPRDFGNYILERRISRSEEAEVFVASARDQTSRCIVKTALAKTRRFDDQARILGDISHENIVRSFDAGEVDGIRYIAMEYVEGRTLGDVIPYGAMPVEIAMYVFEQVLLGVCHLHEQGVVHGDLCPANVLIGYNGSVKVADVGGRRDAGGAAHARATAWAYRPAEQAAGAKADRRSDVFACGALLFELVTGQRYLREPGEIVDPGDRKPSSMGDLPLAFDYLATKSLASDPMYRFADAQQMFDFMNGISIRAGEAGDLIRWLDDLLDSDDMDETQALEQGLHLDHLARGDSATDDLPTRAELVPVPEILEPVTRADLGSESDSDESETRSELQSFDDESSAPDDSPSFNDRETDEPALVRPAGPNEVGDDTKDAVDSPFGRMDSATRIDPQPLDDPSEAIEEFAVRAVMPMMPVQSVETPVMDVDERSSSGPNDPSSVESAVLDVTKPAHPRHTSAERRPRGPRGWTTATKMKLALMMILFVIVNLVIVLLFFR